MWTFPINNSSGESSSTPITVAKEIEPTACETECVEQHKSLVACVESIRAARLQQQQEDANDGQNSDGDGSDSNTTTTSTDTPECLPMAVAAWTKCCEEANLRQRAQNEEEMESGDTSNTS